MQTPPGSYNEQLAQRQRYARRVISNPTDHYLTDAQHRHAAVVPEWIERTIIEPYHQETDRDGRELFFGAIPERGKWLRVVVDNHQLHTAYLDKRLLQWWGTP